MVDELGVPPMVDELGVPPMVDELGVPPLRRGRFIVPTAASSALRGLPDYFVNLHNVAPTPQEC